MLKPKLDLEIANLMDYELAKTANNHNFSNLNQAVDYLNSAIDVLENSGFTAHADALLNVLQKIAGFEERKALIEIPSLAFIREMDAVDFKYENKDIWEILATIQKSQSETIKNTYKAILNNLARSEVGKKIISNILKKNVEELNEEHFEKILEDNYLSKDKAGKILLFRPDLRTNLNFNVREHLSERNKPMFGAEEISNFIESELPTPVTAAARYYLNKLAKKRKPKNPTKTPDPYTKNLNSDKMIKNLKNHGTMFNMPDSNQVDDLLNDDVFEEED